MPDQGFGDAAVLNDSSAGGTLQADSLSKPSNRTPWAIGGVAVLAVVGTMVISAIHVSHRRDPEQARVMGYLPPQAEAPSIASTAMEQQAEPARGFAGANVDVLRVPAAKVVGESKNGPLGPDAHVSVEPMIARTASLTILVKDFASARKSLDMIVTRYGGYSANLTMSTPETGQRQFQASLRIPADRFASVVGDLKTLGRALTESQAGEEVTEQHTDLVARLKNSRETEQRLRAILEQRTGKIEDVLRVEEEIARVRGEIESMESQQKALEHRVAFATITLQLVEEYKERFHPSSSISTSGRLRNAFIEGMRNASSTVLALVLFFEEYGPALLVWTLILGLPGYLLWRRYRRVQERI